MSFEEHTGKIELLFVSVDTSTWEFEATCREWEFVSRKF